MTSPIESFGPGDKSRRVLPVTPATPSPSVPDPAQPKSGVPPEPRVKKRPVALPATPIVPRDLSLTSAQALLDTQLIRQANTHLKLTEAHRTQLIALKDALEQIASGHSNEGHQQTTRAAYTIAQAIRNAHSDDVRMRLVVTEFNILLPESHTAKTGIALG